MVNFNTPESIFLCPPLLFPPSMGFILLIATWLAWVDLRDTSQSKAVAQTVLCPLAPTLTSSIKNAVARMGGNRSQRQPSKSSWRGQSNFGDSLPQNLKCCLCAIWYDGSSLFFAVYHFVMFHGDGHDFPILHIIAICEFPFKWMRVPAVWKFDYQAGPRH